MGLSGRRRHGRRALQGLQRQVWGDEFFFAAAQSVPNHGVRRRALGLVLAVALTAGLGGALQVAGAGAASAKCRPVWKCAPTTTVAATPTT